VPNSPFELLSRYVDVSRETVDHLSLYHDLLLKWQKQINLVSGQTIADAWQRHFLDSLQLLPLIKDVQGGILDLGSGAGFPGMVLAVAGVPEITLLESDARKCVFLREVARETGTKVAVVNQRIEKNTLGKQALIISRACSELGELFALAEQNVSHETICLFHKGKNYANEITIASAQWEYDVEIIPSVLGEQSVILKCTHLTKI